MHRTAWSLVVLGAMGWATPAMGQATRPGGSKRLVGSDSLGMATNAVRSVVVFDATHDVVLGSVMLPSALPCTDCAIAPDLSLGFVVVFNNIVWVIDLTASPPVLAAGTNPIHISNPGEDVLVTPDGRFLLVCDGSAAKPLSVVDVATRTEIYTLAPAVSTNSVDLCPDGSVLVTSANPFGGLRRLLLDGSGALTDTGEFQAVHDPNNVHCAPGGRFGIVVTKDSGVLQSFAIPGLAFQGFQRLGLTGVSAAFDPRGTRLFVRTEADLQAFEFDASTGAIGPLLFTRPAHVGATCFGVDQLATHPDGTKLYVALGPELDILDLDGQPLGMILHGDLVDTRSICIQGSAMREEHLDIQPGDCPNSFNPLGHGVLRVALVGSEEFDVLLVDRSTLRLSRADGFGGSIAPHEGPPGPHSTIEDVSTPFDGEGCDCTALGADGFDDLSLAFRSDDLALALELDQLPAGGLVELVLSGTSNDQAFEARDCARLVPPGTPPGLLQIVSPSRDGWIEASPLDLQHDGGGFGSFERAYPPGSLVTLTAQELEGLRFTGWEVDGMAQAPGERTIHLVVSKPESKIVARYRPVLRIR